MLEERKLKWILFKYLHICVTDEVHKNRQGFSKTSEWIGRLGLLDCQTSPLLSLDDA
jgi:hypothetical protein